MRLSTAALRTVEHKGGLDAFLLNTRSNDLTPEILRLKKRVKNAIARKAAAVQTGLPRAPPVFLSALC